MEEEFTFVGEKKIPLFYNLYTCLIISVQVFNILLKVANKTDEIQWQSEDSGKGQAMNK